MNSLLVIIHPRTYCPELLLSLSRTNDTSPIHFLNGYCQNAKISHHIYTHITSSLNSLPLYGPFTTYMAIYSLFASLSKSVSVNQNIKHSCFVSLHFISTPFWWLFFLVYSFTTFHFCFLMSLRAFTFTTKNPRLEPSPLLTFIFFFDFSCSGRAAGFVYIFFCIFLRFVFFFLCVYALSRLRLRFYVSSFPLFPFPANECFALDSPWTLRSRYDIHLSFPFSRTMGFFSSLLRFPLHYKMTSRSRPIEMSCLFLCLRLFYPSNLFPRSRSCFLLKSLVMMM